MKLMQELAAEGRGQDVNAVLEHIPYARFLGLQVLVLLAGVNQVPTHEQANLQTKQQASVNLVSRGKSCPGRPKECQFPVNKAKQNHGIW